jgi:hypothetical protein
MSDAPDTTNDLPTCTHDGTRPECWYCSLPSWMFDDMGKLLEEWQDYQWPWSKERFWLKEDERVKR